MIMIPSLVLPLHSENFLANPPRALCVEAPMRFIFLWLTGYPVLSPIRVYSAQGLESDYLIPHIHV